METSGLYELHAKHFIILCNDNLEALVCRKSDKEPS